MRSTRNRTRAVRAAEHHHYTDRLSAPIHSNTPDGSRKGNDPVDPRRSGGFTRLNTNSRLKDGGISSYYRSRERGYSA